MKTSFTLTLSFAILFPTYASAAEPWKLDAPMTSLQGRQYLPLAASDTLGESIENVAGRLAVVSNDGKRVEMSTSRVVKDNAIASVKVEKPTASYKSILTKNTNLKAAIPILNVNWTNNQTAQVTVTDVATIRITPDKFPTAQDFATAIGTARAPAGSRIGWVEAAKVSTVSINRLTKRDRGGGLLAWLNISGQDYQEENDDIRFSVISVLVTYPLATPVAPEAAKQALSPYGVDGVPANLKSLSASAQSKILLDLRAKNLSDSGWTNAMAGKLSAKSSSIAVPVNTSESIEIDVSEKSIRAMLTANR